MRMRHELRPFADQDGLGSRALVQTADKYFCPCMAVVRVLVRFGFLFAADQLALLPRIAVLRVRMRLRRLIARLRMRVRLSLFEQADEHTGSVVAILIVQMENPGRIFGVRLREGAGERLLRFGDDLRVAARVMRMRRARHGDGGMNERIAGRACDKNRKADQRQPVPLPAPARPAMAVRFEHG